MGYAGITDRTGQKLGRLTFCWPAGLRKHIIHWLCQCDCGTLVVVSGSQVQDGNTRSCGCLRKERSAAALRTHGHTVGGRTPEYQLWLSAKARARRDSLPFKITVADVVIPEFCPLLDVRLVAGNRKAHANSPSLDKIIPELGYVVGNVQVISHRANWIKSNATIQELEMVVKRWRRT